MYQNILVPLDGSKLAECVLPHVEVLFRTTQAKVTFIRIVEPCCPTAEDAGNYAYPDDVVRKIESKNRSIAQAYLNGIMTNGPYESTRAESVVLHGIAFETLTKYAAQNDVDLIVMATHGLSGLSRDSPKWLFSWFFSFAPFPLPPLARRRTG